MQFHAAYRSFSNVYLEGEIFKAILKIRLCVMVCLLGGNESEGAVEMSGLSGRRVLQKPSGIGVFEGVSLRSNEVLSLLGALLIELQGYKGQRCCSQLGRQTPLQREKGQNRLFLL